METYNEFLERNGLTYSDDNITNPDWVKKFWEAIRRVKIANGDYNFIGFIFPYFDARNFHIEHGSDRLDFDKPVYFQRAKFKGHATFSSMTFKNLAIFSGADFYEDVHFSHPWFEEEAQFDNCTFQKGLQFVGQFLKKCHFNGARFSSDHKTTFSPIGYAEIFKDTAYFTNIIFPETFSFLYCDLSNVSFSGSSLRKLDLIGCAFAERNGRYLVFDEERTFKDRGSGIGTRHFIFLENLYRQLKTNFDEKTDWNLADKFYISEMEAKRLKILFDVMDYNIPSIVYSKESASYENDWKKRIKPYLKKPNSKKVHQAPLLFLYSFYKLVSNYGHNINRGILSLVAVFALGSFTFAAVNKICITNAAFSVLNGMIKQDYSNWLIGILNILVFAILLPILFLIIKRQFKR